MSLHDYVRAAGRHRGKTPAQLRADLLATEAANDGLTCSLIAETTRSETLQGQLDAAGIELSGTRLDLENAEAENERLRRENTRLQAALANATSVDVAAGQRDIDPDDRPTVPMDTHELRDRFETGPIRRIGVSPAAAQPTHVPGTEAA